MSNELFEALLQMEKEKGISLDKIKEMVEQTIYAGIKATYGDVEEMIVDFDTEKQKVSVAIYKNVVEEVVDPANEMTLDEALLVSKRAKIGGKVKIKVDPKKFGRISVQNAKNAMRQNLRKEEREQAFREYQSHNHEITTGVVVAIDPEKGNITLEIGNSQAMLPQKEQIEGEELKLGERVKVYIVDVKETERHPKLLISRTHSGLVKKLFEKEVPEIADGTVEIKAISREAGARTKIAVWAQDENVDAVGACIGNKSSRIQRILDELGKEKIDIIKYSEDPIEFISASLSPAKVVSCEMNPDEEKACIVRVPDAQQSLAIGNKGQNVRLAARLTGYKIDIRPESGFFGEE